MDAMTTGQPRFAILVPTLNAGPLWDAWIAQLKSQTIKPRRVLVLDSASTDDTVRQAHLAGFEVVPVDRGQFNHGGTRQRGVEMLDKEVDLLVCLTQDAVLASADALERLLEVFADPQVAAAYGRQLPAAGADPLASHARIFNYPPRSRTVTLKDRATLGFKACFLSNSFAAYRMRDLALAGGFPRRVILGEDATVAARLLMAGRSIRYEAGACVFHSHNYTPLEEFRRYFDTGVFHARSPWLLEAFGGAGGEGLRFMRSEWRYLMHHAPGQLPMALLRNMLKLVAYRIGRLEKLLPVGMKRRMSMSRSFWSGMTS